MIKRGGADTAGRRFRRQQCLGKIDVLFFVTIERVEHVRAPFRNDAGRLDEFARQLRGHANAITCSPVPAPEPCYAMPSSEQARWFAKEVQPHEPKLRAWLHACFPMLTDIDDLVQESYVRLLRAHEGGRVGNAKTYLFATARNAALDIFRRRRVIALERVEEIERLSVLDEAPGVAETLNHDQELALLAEAVESLPERCRQVLVLQKLHRLSYKEIAARLGISERTVNAQIAKGVLRCRDFMRARLQKRNRP